MHHFAKQLNLLLILPAVLSSTYKGIINEKDINITNIQDYKHVLRPLPHVNYSIFRTVCLRRLKSVFSTRKPRRATVCRRCGNECQCDGTTWRIGLPSLSGRQLRRQSSELSKRQYKLFILGMPKKQNLNFWFYTYYVLHDYFQNTFFSMLSISTFWTMIDV